MAYACCKLAMNLLIVSGPSSELGACNQLGATDPQTLENIENPGKDIELVEVLKFLVKP